MQVPNDADSILAGISSLQKVNPWRTVTVLAPSSLARIQIRRRLARCAKALFNVRFIDLDQFAAEMLARDGQTKPLATTSQKLAAAWAAYHGEPNLERRVVESPDVPATLVRAFDVLDALSGEERDSVDGFVLNLHDRYREILRGRMTRFEVLSAAASVRNASREAVSDDDLIVVNHSPTQHGEAEIRRRLLELPPDSGAADPRRPVIVRGYSLHDEADEAVLVSRLIVRSAVEEGVDLHEVGVVVPSKDPYLKLLEMRFSDVGIKFNGWHAETLNDTAPGKALRLANLDDFDDWGRLAESAKRAVELSTSREDAAAQVIKDSVETWPSVSEIVPQPTESLVHALVKAVLDRPAPRDERFGDGVFVGPLGQHSGLTWRSLIVAGFSHRRFPRPNRRIPFLPASLTAVSASDQKIDLLNFLGRCEQVVLTYSRCDRRKEQEAYRSPWMDELTGNQIEDVPSSARLYALNGVLCDRDRGPVKVLQCRSQSASLPDSVPPATLFDWLSEANAGTSLLPESMSVTDLETFLTCPRRWFLKSRLDLKQPIEVPSFGFTPLETGSMIHDALGQLFRKHADELQNPDFHWSQEHEQQISDHLQESGTGVIAARPGGRRPADSERAELIRWGKKLAEFLKADSDYRAAQRIVSVEVERDLTGDLFGLPLHGRADRIDRTEGGQIHVIDYKSGTTRPSEKESESKRSRGTMMQPTLYAAMASNEADSAWGSYVYVAQLPKKMLLDQPAWFASKSIIAALAAVAKEMLEEGTVPMMPSREYTGELCGNCPYTSICPSSREAIAVRQLKTATGALARYLDVQRPESGDED